MMEECEKLIMSTTSTVIMQVCSKEAEKLKYILDISQHGIGNRTHKKLDCKNNASQNN